MAQTIKLWLDDERDPNNPFIQEDFHSQPEMVKTGTVSYISLDHDLGPHEKETGADLAEWIENEAYYGRLPKMNWAVHSLNFVGARYIIMAMKNAEKFWSQRNV
jgi:hypothetical protein